VRKGNGSRGFDSRLISSSTAQRLLSAPGFPSIIA
jgi:hypothetical protein